MHLLFNNCAVEFLQTHLPSLLHVKPFVELHGFKLEQDFIAWI